MSDLTREEVIEILQSQLDTWDDIPNVDDIKYAFKYAIASLKTDEAYDIIYEGLDVIPVPDGATNGDMMLIVYSNSRYKVVDNGIEFKADIDKNTEFTTWFPLEWWNAPYRRNGNEDNN